MVLLAARQEAEYGAADAATAAVPVAGTTPGRADLRSVWGASAVLLALSAAGLSWFPHGAVAFDVFFVLFGSWVGGAMLMASNRGGRALADVYLRGARTVVPAVCTVVALTLAAASVIWGVARLGDVSRDALWTSVFVGNFRFSAADISDLSGAIEQSPLWNLWPTAVVAQVCLVWPALVWVSFRAPRGSRRRAAWISLLIVLVLASVTWAALQTVSDRTWAYYSPLTRGWELGIGTLAVLTSAWFARRPAWLSSAAGWIALGVILASATKWGDVAGWLAGGGSVPAAMATAVLVAVGPSGGPSRILASAWFRWLGRSSFFFLLVFWPVLSLVVGRFPQVSPIGRMALVPAALASAVLANWMIDRGSRRSTHRSRSPRTVVITAVVAVAVTVGYAGMYVVGDRGQATRADLQFQAQQRVSNANGGAGRATAAAVAAAVTASAQVGYRVDKVTPTPQLAAKDVSSTFSSGCLAGVAATTSPRCTFGDQSVATQVVLLGDGQASQWTPAIVDAAAQLGFGLTVLTKVMCPVSDLDASVGPTRSKASGCAKWGVSALSRIDRLRPSLVLISSSFSDSAGTTATSGGLESDWDTGLEATIARIKATGAAVAVLGETPKHAASVPTCVAANSANLANCATAANIALQANSRAAEAAAATAAGATYVDTSRWFCTEKVCPAVIGGVVTESDDQYVTATYAVVLSRVLAESVGLSK